MSGNKLQIAVIAGLVVSAGLALQAAMPRLANDAGLLYLRAQYKLATGDKDSALQLMQRAATPPQTQAEPQAPSRTQDSGCPYAHSQSVAKANPVSATPHVVSVRQNRTSQPQIRYSVFDLQRDWSARQARMLALIQTRQFENEQRLAVQLAKLEANLHNLPGGGVPVNIPAVVVSGTRAALP